ncbi:MAG: hypothetical protein V4649_11645 [Bacteroidota bacterium]
MYCITDEQIEYILSDIRRNGVDTEDLQLNLLDHICCIMEQELKENDDFERFYHATVKRFYRHDLREIEDETINLLTFKNFYAMKKVLIATGACSVFAFIAGSAFKFMYWPGASMLLTLGIGSFSLLFLPLLVILKTREARAASDKFVVATASVVGAVFSIAILFIVQHWPGANVLLMSAIGLAAFVLLPAYFFTGIRRPEARLNTILVSIILVGIIGLQFTMVRLAPRSSGSQRQIKMDNYVQAESSLRQLQSLSPASEDAAAINTLCDQVKSLVLNQAIGQPAIPANYENTQLILNENALGREFAGNGVGVHLLATLRDAFSKYTAAGGNAALQQMISRSILRTEPSEAAKLYSNLSLLQSITQLQTQLAIGENTKAMAAK